MVALEVVSQALTAVDSRPAAEVDSEVQAAADSEDPAAADSVARPSAAVADLPLCRRY